MWCTINKYLSVYPLCVDAAIILFCSYYVWFIGSGSMCIYGKCFYCKVNETVCPDSKGEIEGAAILFSKKPFRAFKSPWRRSYTSKKMEWEKNNDFCK